MEICRSTEKPCRISRCIALAALVVVSIAALGWVVMLIWNWLMPELFTGAHTVNYCQALGILLLSKILFGSFRCCSRSRERHPHGGNMTPEEREQLRSHFTSRWGKWCCSPKSDDTAAKDVPPHAN